jgi:hypothetical protein
MGGVYTSATSYGQAICSAKKLVGQVSMMTEAKFGWIFFSNITS